MRKAKPRRKRSWDSVATFARKRPTFAKVNVGRHFLFYAVRKTWIGKIPIYHVKLRFIRDRLPIRISASLVVTAWAVTPFRFGRDRSEQSMLFVVDTGGKEQRCCGTGIGTVTKSQRP